MKWHAEAWAFPTDIQEWSIAGGGFVFYEDFLSDEAMKLEYGPLFAYMFRRFGPSEWGSDGHKSIADWFITTPNPCVVLWVKPSVDGGKYSFGYGVRVDRYDNRRDKKQRQEVVEALQAAIADLSTPVGIRDSCINAYGLLPDDVYPERVPYFKYAGYGVSHEQFKKMDEEGD